MFLRINRNNKKSAVAANNNEQAVGGNNNSNAARHTHQPPKSGQKITSVQGYIISRYASNGYVQFPRTAGAAAFAKALHNVPVFFR